MTSSHHEPLHHIPCAGRAPRPSWLTEPCPTWCTREHGEDDHPEDHYHQSAPRLVPAITSTGSAVPVTASLTSLALVVRMGRHVGELLDWLIIESPGASQPRIVLTTESARSLTTEISAQLRMTDR